jgi:hypothetical protein
MRTAPFYGTGYVFEGRHLGLLPVGMDSGFRQ